MAKRRRRSAMDLCRPGRCLRRAFDCPALGRESRTRVQNSDFDGSRSIAADWICGELDRRLRDQRWHGRRGTNFSARIDARFVRLFLNERAKPGGYQLSAFEITGTGGFKAALLPVPQPEADGTLKLSSGWRLMNHATIADEAAAISTRGYNDSKWLIATVPGTVLTSYLNLGAVPNIFYGDHQLQVSDFFAHTNWWYRNEVEVPASYHGRRVWLNFDGINYRAFIYVNGKAAGNIEGAFTRGKFDISEFIIAGKRSCIAVLILPVPIFSEIWQPAA